VIHLEVLDGVRGNLGMHGGHGVLSDRNPAAPFDFGQPRGAVVHEASQNHAGHPAAIGVGGGTEQGVDGGARAVFPRPVREADFSAGEQHVAIGRSDIEHAPVTRAGKLSLELMSLILDGNRVRDEIKNELRPRVTALAAQGRPPGLAVVLVGNNPASEIYVRNKIKACHDLGIYSESLTPPDTVSTAELLGIVEHLNTRHDIDGILVQLPLPAQVDTKRILLAVAPEKDVDGFHPMNVGKLVAGLPGPRACTPAGIIEILRRYQIPIAGKRAVVVGRSDIVGKPVAMLLLHEHATVTICHSKTPDLAAVCREGEILVAAMGRPAAITAEYIRPGATVIDVGTTRVENREQVARIFRNSAEKLAAFDKRGNVLVGDVHPLDMAEKASAYTPVPGGVGPLTIAMLMVNTVASAERRSPAC
jgi:methylenetetrahydrofolate dehydrogenase (NADP+) / methenyltetrahydrofolate cyclohydrolase